MRSTKIIEENEAFVRRFHAVHTGATRAAFASTQSYAQLTAAVEGATCVLDLACGNAPLANAIGVDLSLDELHLAPARGRVVQARGEALPFRDHAFDAGVCHLALMLVRDPDSVVRELHRVLAPGARFAAVLGGGPVGEVDPDDAFQRFLELARPHLIDVPIGNARVRDEAGWRALFGAGWADHTFTRHEHDLGGAFADVWQFLGASYQLDPTAAETVRTALAESYGGAAQVPCRVVTYLATVTRAVRGVAASSSPATDPCP